MPTQTLSNAVVDPQDPGTGISDYDPNAAAIQALARSHEQGEYVGDGLQFANVDTTNDHVDLTAGYCYILDDSASTAGSRSSGGQPQTMSTASAGYDTEIPTQIPYVVVVPSDVVDVSLEAGVNDVYISVDPSAQNAVTLHYGTAISAPTEPSLYLGTVDTSDGSTTSGDSGQSQDLETLTTEVSTIASELGIPSYGDVANAPATDGRIIYITGDGVTTPEGLYQRQSGSYVQVGGGGGEWAEDGSGNIVPIDGETVGDGTTTANHDAVTANTSITDSAGVSHTGELADDGDTQPPEAHAIGGSAHNSDTLANLNALISDATLDGSSDSRPPEAHDNADHSTDMVEDATTTGNAPYEIQKNGTDGTGIINFKT